MAAILLRDLPNNFDTLLVRKAYPLDYNNTMNTVLIQEVLRYNSLLNILRSSLKDLLLALKGQKVMTATLDNVAESLINNVIPASWAAKSFPSLKPLLSYHKDVCKRVDMLNTWIAEGPPTVFWLPGFYFT